MFVGQKKPNKQTKEKKLLSTTSMKPDTKIFKNSPLRLIANRAHWSLFRPAHTRLFLSKKTLKAADCINKG